MAKPVGEIIAFCPKCNKSIGDQNPYAWCVDCGEPFTPEIKTKIPHLVQQEQQAIGKEPATKYNYQRIGDNWQQKSKEQLISAAERLSTFTPEEEDRIRAELQRRSMPEPGPTVRTAQSIETSSENMDGTSSMGLQPNIAATLSYALVWIVGNISWWIVIRQMIPGFASGAYDNANLREVRSLMPHVILSLIISGALTSGAGFIFFVMEKESRFVRVHAMQAILFGILWFAWSIVISIGAMALGDGIAVLSIPGSIAFLVVWILLMVRAYKGDMFKLSFISEQAENIVPR